MSHWNQFEADRAFTAASRARRGAALLGRVRRPGRAICGLPVYDEAIHRRSGPRGVTEISLEAIAGTTEPNRAAQFDHHFRPKPLTRGRWQRVWIAVQQGVTLPPDLGRADRRRLRDPRRPPPRVGGQGARRADDHRAGGLVTTHLTGMGARPAAQRAQYRSKAPAPTISPTNLRGGKWPEPGLNEQLRRDLPNQLGDLSLGALIAW